MPLDCYKVEVIHYLSPHQIWIEVRDPTVLNEDFLFEQIGVYGVLPQEKSIDIHTESLTSLSCEEWLPAAVVAMKDLLAESDEVWFSPIHIDRRTSIFDDNIHKYGEIICKTKNGKRKKLSKYLIKSGFAYLNVCEFHEKLSCGKLNTELNTTQTQQVTMELEKYCLRKDTPKNNRKNSVEEQTSELNRTQNFESSLTVSNLERHNKEIIKKTLKNEYKDFAVCENVDKSLGRAYRKAEITQEQDKKTLLLSKLTLCKQIANSPKHHESTSFKYPKNFEKARLVDDYFENAHPVEDLKMEQNEMKKLNTFKKSIDETDSCGHQFEGKAKSRNHLEKKFRSQHQLEEKRSSHQTGVKTDYDFQEKKVEMHNTAKRNVKPTRHRSAVTAQIAFGPPEMDLKFFKIKTITDPDEEEEYEKKKNIEIEKVATSEKRDCMYGNVDSEVGVEITNKKTLKDYLNKGINGGNANDSEKTVKNYEKSVKSSEINDCSITSNVKCKHKEVMLENCAEIKKKDNLVGISNIKNELKEEYVKNSIEMNYRDEKKIQNENELVKCGEEINDTNNSIDKKLSSVIKRKLKIHKTAVNYNSSFSSSDTSNKVSSGDVVSNNKAEDDENIVKEIENLYFKNKDDNINKLEDRSASESVNTIKLKNNVNPFKNIDPNMSVFVDKLVTPVLMVHSKHDKRIQPAFEMRDVYFNTHIKNILRNMAIEGPMMLQSLSWPVILRGYSLFMISPMASGKTLGYLPAVCRLVSDSKLLNSERGGPVCIIVCATAQSVTNVEKLAKMFLESDKKVLACYAGVDNFHITSTLLNGCDLLIATPSSLVKLLHATDFGVHLRHLSTFVLDDCERLSQVYADEINFFTYKIREMLKIRAKKELNVQYVLASRIWCDFMESLAKKVPDTVICIGAFQECVLYSKSNTSVALVKKVNKVDSVMEFLKDINASKRTVIVCQSKEEVALLERALKRSKHIIFSCNDDMTVHDLYNLSVSWADYKEPLIGPILICCDGNLIHMNITDAHNLIHYSMPPLFSMFCKRFSVLNDNYPSIFKTNNENVKIKVLLEESNVEQLPKILNFIKRCTDNVPSVLDEIASNVLKERDVIKAAKYYPLCDSLLTLGYCPDVYNCQERHTILKDYDAPKDWLPKEGTITCKVLYYHSATLFSARILSCTINGTTTNYPQTYNQLSLKMGMYYSKESNRKLHGIPEIGDICATSIKLNFYVRCQVLKILDRYERGNPNKILVKLIDEERLEVTRDIYLYHLPDELKKIEARVVQVRLANIEPKDKDITFSELARDRLKQITETDTELFVRGDVCLTLGNCIFVNTLEACLDLTSLNETVVKHNLKQELLENHAIPNPEHLFKLQKLCTENGLILKEEINISEPKTPIKNLPKGTWAHLEKDSLSRVFFASAINPHKFFVRLDKFDPVMAGLLQDIEKYVDSNPTRCANVKEGEIVLAKFPADDTYERARIEGIKEETAKCFFVDQGDWSDIPFGDLIPITEKFINQLPFQAIECRLVGIQPLGVQWTDFSTYWFIDSCHNDKGDLKYLFVKYFTKEPAEFTNGHKYSVAVIDTSTDQDVILNQLMIDLNLAQVNHNEIKYLDDLDLKTPEQKQQSDTEDDVRVETQTAGDPTKETENVNTDEKYIVPVQSNILFKAPIRSVPLVNSDNESDDSDKWDVNVDDDCMNLFPALKNLKDLKDNMPKVHTGNAVPSAEQDNNLFPALKNVKDLEDNMLEVHTTNMVKSAERDDKKAVIIELDSDDLTSPDNSFVSPDKPILTTEETNKDTKPILDMRKKSVLDLRTETDEKKKVLDLRAEIDLKRRPKLVWCQNTTSVTIKIQLIGVDNYNLDIKGRILSFSADVNDTEYGFEIELYGVVQETCSHVNKGQYILVKLKKVLTKNWLTLTKDSGIKKWIVYDVDGLDIPDEESTEDNNEDIFCNIRNRCESESEDDDFDDDISRGYKKYD